MSIKYFLKKLTSEKALIAMLLSFTTLFVYGLSYHGEGVYLNYFVPLADAFLHGRLYLLENPPWLNELVDWHGKFYVVYPPMPAIMLIPFVAIWGINFPQPYLSIIIASVNVGLSFLAFSRLFNKKVAIISSLLYAFGTIQWYHAQVGSAWYIAHIIAMFFIWLSILEVVGRQRLFLIGLLIGFAYLSRLPALLSLVFPLFFLHDRFIKFQKGQIELGIKSGLMLILGLIPGLLFNAWYNFARFGVPFDIGYSLLPVFNEPWYRFGLVSIKYIPEHLKEIFTAMPRLISNPPFVIPSIFVMALWVVTPAFLLIPLAKYKQKVIFAAAAAAVFVSIPSLVHGGNGLTQFGYRYSLDYTPFLLILVASALGEKIKWWSILLIILSILINLWGVVMLSFLKLSSF